MFRIANIAIKSHFMHGEDESVNITTDAQKLLLKDLSNIQTTLLDESYDSLPSATTREHYNIVLFTSNGDVKTSFPNAQAKSEPAAVYSRLEDAYDSEFLKGAGYYR